MTPYQISTIEHAWVALIAVAAASALQWGLSPPGPRRIPSSLHGTFFLSAFAYAVIVSPYSDTYPTPNLYHYPFNALLLAGVVAAFVNPFLKASRLAVAIGTSSMSVIAGTYLAFIGGMAIAHDWI